MGLLRAALIAVTQIAAAVLLFPISAVLHLVGYRRLNFVTTRIGHLAAEPDCFLKARALGELPDRKWFFLADPAWVANDHLAGYWSRLIPAVRTPVACRLLGRLSALGLMRYDVGRYVQWYDRAQEIYRLNARWAGRPPLLSLTLDDEVRAQQALSALGVPADRWFVAVHVREGGFAPDEEVRHRHRNADPWALVAAMQEIVARGGWCIRMGDPTMQRLDGIQGVVDYAHHPLRSARLDVVLCAKARFFLGNSSGLGFVASVFGRPSLLVNVVPMAGIAPWPGDLSIPKLYWSTAERRYLAFHEVLATPAASYRFAAQYDAAGIELHDNTAEEIRDAAIEMLDLLEDNGRPNPLDEELSARFIALLGPSDYGYGAASRISGRFLRRHADLLPAQAAEFVP